MNAELGERPNFPHPAESQVQVQASAGPVFEHLDDHTPVSAHMNRRAWRMGWSRMRLSLDGQAGRAIASRIQLERRVLGVQLSLDQVVTEHRPPTRKVWMTVGSPRLLGGIFGRWYASWCTQRMVSDAQAAFAAAPAGCSSRTSL